MIKKDIKNMIENTWSLKMVPVQFNEVEMNFLRPFWHPRNNDGVKVKKLLFGLSKNL